MKQICDTMEVMTECINQSDEASRTMLSKYEESSVNVDKIESVVGKLMEELGSGGFMGIGDAQPGMHVVLVAKNGAQAAGTEFHGEVFESQSDGVLVKIKPEAGKTIEIKKKDITYELQICVNKAVSHSAHIRRISQMRSGRIFCWKSRTSRWRRHGRWTDISSAVRIMMVSSLSDAVCRRTAKRSRLMSIKITGNREEFV